MAQSQYLASDDANPDFAGQRDPDRSLSVMFYKKPIQNNYETQQKGRPIFDEVDMVRIYLPGDEKNVVDTYARDDHKERFPRQWAHYKNKMEGDQQLVGKTPLTEWPRLSTAQVEELRAMKFFSVDDIANANDGVLARLGMVAGQSPFAFREAAQRFLKIAAAAEVDTKQAEALDAVTKENAEMKEQMAAMQAQLARLAQLQSEPAAGEETPARRGRAPADKREEA